MHILRNINWIAVLVGTIGYFMLGALLYSFLFQKKWIAYNKMDISDPNGKKGVGAIMFGSFVRMFITVLPLLYLLRLWASMIGWVVLT